MPELATLLTPERIADWFAALVVLVIGVGLARLLRSVLARVLPRRLSTQHAQLGGRAVYYTVLGLTLASALRQVGVDLSFLLGAAGLLTVAIGFASQTSVSNLISGLFLVAERPFDLGDTIRVGSTTGQVLSVDLLSVKLRTFDNLFVRLPNENLLKSEIVNLTRFPIRRLDLPIELEATVDLATAKIALLELMAGHEAALAEPPPACQLEGFVDGAVRLLLTVWTAQENLPELRNHLVMAIPQTLTAKGITLASVAAPLAQLLRTAR